MGNIKEFYDLDAWKKAHKLVVDIYSVTKEFPASEIYGITSQIRRAAASVTANIAEGFSRYHYNDKINFYYHARGSISEVQNFLLIARDLKYLSCSECEKLIKGVRRYK
jgi:four helix bundle protein